MILVFTYIAAIVSANLIVAAVGPWAVPINSFVLIALDLVIRDRLHDKWGGNHLMVKMGALIAAGGLIAWTLNPAAQMIAIASSVAFACAAIADGVTYHLTRYRPWLIRSNASNVAGAAVDSVVFHLISFGGVNPSLFAAQFVAKVSGGAVWSWIFSRLK